jgi:hypothetical protein
MEPAESPQNNEIRNFHAIAHGGPMEYAIKQVFPMMPHEYLEDLLVVYPNCNGTKEDLELALRKMEENPNLRMILWLIFLHSKNYQYDLDFSKIPANSPRVKILESYLDLPSIIARIKEFYDEKQAAGGQTAENSQELLDPAILQLKLAIKYRLMQTLKHDLKPYVIEAKGEKYRGIITTARREFGIKDSATDQQVEDFISKTRLDLQEKMQGEITGVYCDLDDTAMLQDGSINAEVLKMLEQFTAEGKNVMIWTGGNLDEAKAKIAGTALEKFPVVSKLDYTGATAEIVIDNVSVEKFCLQYGIKPQKYVRV